MAISMEDLNRLEENICVSSIAAMNPEVGMELINTIRLQAKKIALLEKEADFLAKQCPVEGTESWPESIEYWRQKAREVCGG